MPRRPRAVRKTRPALLRDQTNDARAVQIKFLDTDMDAALTFLNLAETELGLGELQRAKELISKANTAATTVERHIQLLPPEEEPARQRLRHRLKDLKQLIAAWSERTRDL